MFNLDMRKPLLIVASVVTIILVATLSIQTWRLNNSLEREESLKIKVVGYISALDEVRASSSKRESAITRSVERERVENDKLSKKLEAIAQDVDAPLPDIIGNAIDRL